MNSRFPEYMELLKLLFAQNSRFVSNIPIFPSDIFTLILLRVPVRVKMVCLFSLAKHSHKTPPFPTSTFYHRTQVAVTFRFLEMIDTISDLTGYTLPLLLSVLRTCYLPAHHPQYPKRI